MMTPDLNEDSNSNNSNNNFMSKNNSTSSSSSSSSTSSTTLNIKNDLKRKINDSNNGFDEIASKTTKRIQQQQLK
jgi:hypothetical protein